jgi:hypothetical protein
MTLPLRRFGPDITSEPDPVRMLLLLAAGPGVPQQVFAQSSPVIDREVEEFTLGKECHVNLHRDATTPMVRPDIW